MISLLINYQVIDFIYIKKTLQIFLCFYIFVVFSEEKKTIDFNLFENLLIIFISLITLFALFHYNLIFFGIVYFLIFFLCLIFLKKRLLFFNSSILFYLILYFYVYFYINAQYDYLDIEAFIRKNSISWVILLTFIANKIFRKKKNLSLDFFIILFTLLFCAKYVFLIQILIYGLISLTKKNKRYLDYIFILSFLLPVIYTITIIFFTSHYLELINNIYNYIFDLENLGIIVATDNNLERIYEVSQINFHTNNFFTEIYLGLTHRALLAEIVYHNIINNIIINDNYLININYYSASFSKNFNQLDLNELNKFKNSDFITDYKIYFKKCSDISMRIDECGLKLGFIDPKSNISENIIQLIFNQNFNSSHNQFIDLLSKFGISGFLIFFFLIFKIIKLLNKYKNNYNIKIICITIFILLNFDNYLFYNYFNISYFLWIILGLSINQNILVKDKS